MVRLSRPRKLMSSTGVTTMASTRLINKAFVRELLDRIQNQISEIKNKLAAKHKEPASVFCLLKNEMR